jgi:hypothetical protein
MMALLALAATAARARPLVVRLSPADCSDDGGGALDRDCHSAIAAAVARCRAHGRGCAVELAPGDYRVVCTAAERPSSTQIEAPAVSLAHTVGIVFGGAASTPPHSRPSLLIDYVGGGCAGIVADNATDVRIQNVVVDAYRAPFTVARLVGDSTATAVRFVPEVDSTDRAGLYTWDTHRWPWLSTVYTSQVVASGGRATRELADVGLSNAAFSSAVSESGVVTLTFAQPLPSRAQLRCGQRVFLKHYNNMQSWGVHGQAVRGDMQVSGVSLWSVAGMGYRCDLCQGNYSLLDSSVEIRAGSARPMSVTADAVHFMHHAGQITLRRSSFQGGGDDGFNVHGNFVVLSALPDLDSDASSSAQQPQHAQPQHAQPQPQQPRAGYIDETGPGWITAAPTFFIDDEVEFYSRRTLQKLGTSVIASATATEIVFATALPSTLKRYDMLLSLKRVASLTMEGCFFGNSNSRGAVISAVHAIIINNTFANLTHPGLIFIEGGCGANAGDYTEGPFSQDVRIESNSFANVATVGVSPSSINNLAMLQFTGCRPIGECGISGQQPASSSTAAAGHRAGGGLPLALQPAGGGIMRVVRIDFGGNKGDGAAMLHSIKFMAATAGEGARHSATLQGLVAGVYESSLDGSHPTTLLAIAGGSSSSSSGVYGDKSSVWQRDGRWYRAPLLSLAPLAPPLKLLHNGSFWLALWQPPNTTTAVPPPLQLLPLQETQLQYKSWRTPDGLALHIGANWSQVSQSVSQPVSEYNSNLVTFVSAPDCNYSLWCGKF